MRKVSCWLVLGLAAVWGCSPGSTGSSSTGQGDGQASGTAAEAPTGEGKVEGKVEVVAFKGGYDIDFYAACAKEFQEKNAGLQATVDGDPRIWEKIRPRMAGGDVPDLMFPGWGMDHWGLVQDGGLLALDKALDSPAYGGKGTWRESFDPRMLKFCQKDGKTYMLPLYVMVYGWWYDPAVFAKHGWTPPNDTDELLALAEKIKAAGMAPLTFQGKYPYYMLEGMLMPWIATEGGIGALDACQNLDPGAWKAEPVLKAAQMVAALRDKGCFLDGSVGLDHTQSQTAFLNGKAAMIPCGSWLDSEMKKSMPPGASVRYFRVPFTTGGTGDPTTVLVGIEPWMVPTKAKNPNAAVALYKYMTSAEKAKQFVEQKGTLMSIVGSETAKMDANVKSQYDALKESKTVWADQVRFWYPEMQKELEGAMTELLSGKLTPEQFCETCEAAADKARKDTTLAKYKVN